MSKHQLLGMSGSLRKDATNRFLLRNAARLYGDVDYTEADLKLPLYDGDLEAAEGIPDSVAKLVAQIKAADAVIISTPEYNKMLTGVLKNALDWVSRVKPQPWEDKPVAVMSAAAGRAGGERAQVCLVAAMTPFQPNLVIGPEVAVAGSSSEFDEHGVLKNERYEANLIKLMAKLRASV
ncbi:NAD(P)H-dependent FMN reductase [Aliiroseovarius halocynthiae]|uniref:NAD(P)H-dependent oxidoreductase n=1 Tax=Aliiroseovarius halocynthiae TaxID=985055 RepID=A0A545SN35_9RHOB|nr:NAD(P)H-dependent oxidoreductase [Aliiroseovarius halocynthiae]TQV66398.1 NAD(P)H-dependent oxidoreductase [Aliiroseovarius halocynthiae]SMR83376.1 NAD(P)H-dependent FMN reductase [Aliiroseovarius halocynthiae]